MSPNKVYSPLPPPARNDAQKSMDLSTEQETMYQDVLAHFSKEDYTLPGEEKGALIEDEKFWLTYECILRFLRATKWHSAKAAIERLEGTLKWRREFGLNDRITPEHVEPEAVTGKEILLGYDTARRPAFYMIPSRQNTDEAKRQIEFAIFMLERNIDLMAPGVETMTWLINYADKAKNPSLSTARTVLHILQTHYPERLGLALILNVPFLLNAFFKIISPLIDPVTRAKMRFNPKPFEDNLFARDQMMTEWWGGDIDFEYEHKRYWPVLMDMCMTRRGAWKAEWRRMGGQVGLKEWDYKSAIEGKESVVDQNGAEAPNGISTEKSV